MFHYWVVTLSYWGFTLTDGAIRMLVVLYFHRLGFSPFEVAMLFLFYEFFGVVTNLAGGWLGSRLGLNTVMTAGLVLQVIALSMLMVPDQWLGVAYVMAAQALSGIAKDLNKMSAKASIRYFLPEKGGSPKLFRLVAVLTGSKNAIKGAGFFVGAMLLELAGFRGAVGILAGLLVLVLLMNLVLLPARLGKSPSKPKFLHVFSQTAAINWLSAARLFLFGARDVWFVVALPVFLYTVFGWSFMQVGSFMASWVIGYGFVQASVPGLLKRHYREKGVGGHTVSFWGFMLTLVPALMAAWMALAGISVALVVGGLAVFGVVFAINSAVHSYLVVAWSEHDKAAMNVGFYYMANAMGRLIGTVLSGAVYQYYGLQGCLWVAAAFLLLSSLLALKLPAGRAHAEAV